MVHLFAFKRFNLDFFYIWIHIRHMKIQGFTPDSFSDEKCKHATKIHAWLYSFDCHCTLIFTSNLTYSVPSKLHGIRSRASFELRWFITCIPVRYNGKFSVYEIWKLRYVVIRARLRRLGAEITYLDEFTRGYRGLGQADMMFTLLHSCYVQICREKSLV